MFNHGKQNDSQIQGESQSTRYFIASALPLSRCVGQNGPTALPFVFFSRMTGDVKFAEFEKGSRLHPLAPDAEFKVNLNRQIVAEFFLRKSFLTTSRKFFFERTVYSCICSITVSTV